MEKSTTDENDIEFEHTESDRRKEGKVVTDSVDGVYQHVHAKTLILLFAVVGVYGTQVFYVTGSGLLANTITAVTGGANRSIWLISATAIGACALGPPVSQAADYWGRKLFLVGLTVCSAVGSLLASRSNSFVVLIIGQTIASLAFGAQPLCHAIASEILPRKYRPLAQGACNTAAALGGSIGLLIGGALVRKAPENFRIYFYITTSLYTLAAFVIFCLYNPPSRNLQQVLTLNQKLGRLDWFGYVLYIPGLMLFSFALTSSSGVYAWKSAQIIVPLVVGSSMLLLFIVYEWKYTREEFAIFVEGLVFFATNAYYGFEIVVLFDQDLFNAGLYYAVGFFTMIVVTNVTGLYCSRTKTVRAPLIVAYVFFAVFCGTMASVNVTMRRNALGYIPFFGIALGTALNAIVTVAQLSTPPDLISITTGLMIGTRSLGGTVGLSIFSAIFTGTLNRELPKKVMDAALPLGLDPKYLGLFLGGLTTGNSTLLDAVPGVNPRMLQAAGGAVKEAYSVGFRYVWISGVGFSVAGAIAVAFIINPKSEFNSRIDAPIETEDELRREETVESFPRYAPQYAAQA